MPTKHKPALRLNAEQQIAVDAGEGVWGIVSGPGAGKTTVLIARYARLVLGDVPPDDILGLSFTSEAAKNMRKRAEATGAPEKSGDRTAGFLTFHSVALSFAIQEREHFPFRLAEFPLATEAQTGKAVAEVAHRFSADGKALRSYISLQKRTRVSPEQAIRNAEEQGEGEKQALAYKAYETKLRELGVLDFDSLLVEMAGLLERHAEVRARWQYRFIMVDECQDLDALQYRILQLISEKHGNVFCVGDPGQGIYAFRSARPELFQNLSETFPGAKTLYLARNHRSTKSIVSFCQTVGPVKELAERFHTENETGRAPEILKFNGAFEEAGEIVRRIKEGVVHNPDSVAILARTNRALRPFEDALSVAGIRYKNLGKAGFYSQNEIRSLLAYVQCIVAPYDSAVLGALRAPFEPTRFLRKKEIADRLIADQKRDPTKPSIHSLLAHYTPNDLNQHRSLQGFRSFLFGLTKHRNLSAGEAVKAVIRETRAADYYADGENADIDNSPAENLSELIRAASRFQTVPEFLDHVRRVQGAAKSKKGVCLGTIHAAKGLEMDDVFVVSCEEGILPHKNSESIDEEARIFFVAVSRAAKHLVITYSGTPSRFLQPFLPPPPAERDPFFD